MWRVLPKKVVAPNLRKFYCTRQFVEHALWEYKERGKLTRCFAVYCPDCFFWYLPKKGERNCGNSRWCVNSDESLPLTYPKFHEEEMKRTPTFLMYKLPPEDYLPGY